MKVSASGQRLLFLLTIVVAVSARAEDRPRHATAPPQASALSPVTLPVTPHFDGAGGYGLRLRMRYLENLTGSVELHRHPRFPDDNLKARHPRTSIAWRLRWRF